MQLTSEGETMEPTQGSNTKLYLWWVLFAGCLLVHLLISAVSVVPGSSAAKAVAFLYPGSMAVAALFLVVAIWKTVCRSQTA